MQSTVSSVQALAEARSVSLQGGGHHFSVGANAWVLTSLASSLAEYAASSVASFAVALRDLYAGFMRLRTLSVPLVSAVHGVLVGGGVAACLSTDYLVAEHSTRFEQGNLVRGVCPLGMFSRTLTLAVGQQCALAIYLQNVQFDAITALALGLCAAVRVGVEATKARAHDLARLAADTKILLTMPLRQVRSPVDVGVLAKEAVGHVECQFSGGGLAKSLATDHQLDDVATVESRLTPLLLCPEQSLQMERSMFTISVSLNTDVELEHSTKSLAWVCRSPLRPEQNDGAVLLRRAASRVHLRLCLANESYCGVAVVEVERPSSELDVATAMSSMVTRLHLFGLRLRAFVLKLDACILSSRPSSRATNQLERAFDTLHSLSVPIVGYAAGAPCGSIPLAKVADYLVSGVVNEVFDTSSAAMIPWWLGGRSPRSLTARSRALQFAAWLARHAAIGLNQVLQMKRCWAQDRPKMGQRASALLGNGARSGTRCETFFELARDLACTSGSAQLPRSRDATQHLTVTMSLTLPPTSATCIAPNEATAPYRHAGVHALDVYAPRHCVSAAALNAAEGKPPGEQLLHERYSACGEDEDTVSMALTVIQRLMRRWGVRSEEVGQLQLSTASLLDRSKSTKTELMVLLETGGWANTESVDTQNAGAKALLSCVSWIQGRAWDGRWSLMVSSDVQMTLEASVGAAMAALVGTAAPLAMRVQWLGCSPLKRSLDNLTVRHAISSSVDGTSTPGDAPSLWLGALISAVRGSPAYFDPVATITHTSAAFRAICSRRPCRRSTWQSNVVQSYGARPAEVYYLQEVDSPSVGKGMFAADGAAPRRYMLETLRWITYARVPDLRVPQHKHEKCKAASHALAVSLPSLLTSVCVQAPASSMAAAAPALNLSHAVREVMTELIPGVSADVPLMDAGLDSLGAGEVRVRLLERLGDALELPEMLIFDFPTVRQIETHLSATLQPAEVLSAFAPAASASTGFDLVLLARMLSSLGAGGQIVSPVSATTCTTSTVDTARIVREVMTELIPGVSADVPLMDAGLDSLGAGEVRVRLLERLGDALELPEMLIFDFPTVRQIETHLSATLQPDSPARVCSSVALPDAMQHMLHSAVVPTSLVSQTQMSAETVYTELAGKSCTLPAGISMQDALARIATSACDMVSSVPMSRWDVKHVPEGINEDIARRTRHGAFVWAVEHFDNRSFGVSPAEAVAMDPQQRHLLEDGYVALHASGRHRVVLNGSGAGVAVGIYQMEYAQILADSPLGCSVYLTQNALSIASGRVSFALGLHGPCASFETACSASLVACHSAVRALQLEECDAHLVTGVNLMLARAYNCIGMAIAGMTSIRGRSHTFDYRADGFARGEGASSVALTRGKVHCGLRGSAVRQDGRSASLTAPNGQAQQHLLCAALAEAAVGAESLAVNEAHGTGTPLGDPIEVASLAVALLVHRRCSRAHALSGIKGNLAHGESMAGTTGLLTLALMMQRGLTVPNVQLRVINPAVCSTLHVAKCNLSTQIASFPEQQLISAVVSELRFGGVSSFGYSGTIVHAVLAFKRGGKSQLYGFDGAKDAHPSCPPAPPCYCRRAFPWYEVALASDKDRTCMYAVCWAPYPCNAADLTALWVLCTLSSTRGDSASPLPRPTLAVLVHASASSASPALHATRLALALAHRLTGPVTMAPSRVLVLTCSAVAFGGGCAAYGGVGGFVRALRLEHPVMYMQSVDMTTSGESAGAPLALTTPMLEPEIRRRATGCLGTRLRACETARVDMLTLGAYAVTGGLGGLGVRAAAMLVYNGASEVLLSSRSGLLARSGQLRSVAVAKVVMCNSADCWDTGALITSSLLAGVLHAAGILRDRMLRAMSADELNASFAPKANGAAHAHVITSARQLLEVFGLFSSVASTFGNIGQANYAAANAYLDALALSRRVCGTVGSSLQIPAVSGTGMGAATFAEDQLEAMGAISLDVFAAHLCAILAPAHAAVESTQAPLYPVILISMAVPLLSELRHVPASSIHTTIAARRALVTGSSALVQSLAVLVPSQRQAHVERLVLRVVYELTGTVAASVTVETPLMEAGVDSLAATELVLRLRALTGVMLPPTLIFEHSTPRAVASHVFSKLAYEASAMDGVSFERVDAVAPQALTGALGRGSIGRGGDVAQLQAACGGVFGGLLQTCWALDVSPGCALAQLQSVRGLTDSALGDDVLCAVGRASFSLGLLGFRIGGENEALGLRLAGDAPTWVSSGRLGAEAADSGVGGKAIIQECATLSFFTLVAPLVYRRKAMPWTAAEQLQNFGLGVLQSRSAVSLLWHCTLSAANLALLRGHHIGTVPAAPGPLYIHVARAVMNASGHRGAITMQTGKIFSIFFLDEDLSYTTLVTSLERLTGIVEVSSQSALAPTKHITLQVSHRSNSKSLHFSNANVQTVQARCAKVVNGATFVAALGNLWEGEFRSVHKCWTRFGEALIQMRFESMQTEPILRGSAWNEVGATSGILKLQKDGHEDPLPPNWAGRPVYAKGMGTVHFESANSMQTRVMWAHHTATAMRFFNSHGRLVTEGIGGEGLGTFEPGWLEYRRAKIMATRKKSSDAADSPGAISRQSLGVPDRLRAYSTCWAALAPVSSIKYGEQCLLLSLRSSQNVVASMASARCTVAILCDCEPSGAPSHFGVQIHLALAQQLSGFVPLLRLLMLTHGALRTDVTHASVWGFVRSLRLEHRVLGVKSIDVSPDTCTTVAALFDIAMEAEVCWSYATRTAARLRVSFEPLMQTGAVQGGLHTITGGLGGLGLCAAAMLVVDAAAAVALSSRSGRMGRDVSGSQLIASGASVCLLACDVGDTADALSFLSHAKLISLLHAAGMLRDKLLRSMAINDIRAVFAPKAVAAWHLGTALAPKPLQMVGLFSSLASTFGNVGQANYAGGNTYLDAFASYQRRCGVLASSIQIPTVNGAGMGATTFNQEQLNATSAISLDEFAACLCNTLRPARAAAERVQAPLPSKLLGTLDGTGTLVEMHAIHTCEEEMLLAKQVSSLPRSTGAVVRLRSAEHVLSLELNDPAYFNALTMEMASDMLNAVEWLASQERILIKSLVLQGAGDHFCPGGAFPCRSRPRCLSELVCALASTQHFCLFLCVFYAMSVSRSSPRRQHIQKRIFDLILGGHSAWLHRPL